MMSKEYRISQRIEWTFSRYCDSTLDIQESFSLEDVFLRNAKLGRSSVGNSSSDMPRRARTRPYFFRESQRAKKFSRFHVPLSVPFAALLLRITIKCRSNCKVLDRWLHNEIA